MGKIALGACIIATALPIGARAARADVTSWLGVGGGYALERNRSLGVNDFATTLTYSLGVGSSPLQSVVFGGLVRGTTFIDLGTDLGVALRASTGGFARGDWGVALEGGALWRPWRGGAYGAWPLQGVLTVGAPWGLQLALGGETATLSGERSALGAFAVLEVDLLRLTLMRQGSTEKWWYNPSPAGGHLSGQGDGLTRTSDLRSSAWME